MDTGTHLIIGFGLAGLAYVDPVVASNPGVAAAVMAGTVLGSQIPDADTVLRFRDNASYIRHHRGMSHSLPALALWTMLLTAALRLFFGPLPLWHIVLWVFAAVSFHVFTDMFNTYGTQALRPITDKWIRWNIIHIFDPFIFISNLTALFMWALHLEKPEVIFPALYVLIGLYYVWRTMVHKRLQEKMPALDQDHQSGDRYLVIPTISLYHWNILKIHREQGHYTLGELHYGQLQWVDQIRCASHPAVEASKRHRDIRAFLYFTEYACAEVRSHAFGYEIRWVDVRYRHRKQYPFVAVLLTDLDYRPLDSYVGWLSDEKLEKKLGTDSGH